MQATEPPTSDGGDSFVAGAYLYTVNATRVRAGPSTDTAILMILPAGEPVKILGVDGPWHNVSVFGKSGWIRSDLLTEQDTMPTLARPPRVPPPTPSMAVQAPKPERSSRRSSSGDRPIRNPYVGTCDCPYDLMRNGRRCGGRSAYSRPGGREPACYQ